MKPIEVGLIMSRNELNSDTPLLVPNPDADYQSLFSESINMIDELQEDNDKNRLLINTFDGDLVENKMHEIIVKRCERMARKLEHVHDINMGLANRLFDETNQSDENPNNDNS